jgi:Glycosyl hydrolase 109, C-terminal domain/Oxidoreductase family, NAD-binding Rossmann fold
MEINRRNFMKKATIAGLSTAAMTAAGITDSLASDKPDKKAARVATERIRTGFIGTGNRGQGHLKTSLTFGNIDIVSICDISERSLSAAKKIISGSNRPEPKVYTGSDYAFFDMVEKEHLDAVIIATPWEWHTRMAVASMKSGAYTGVEVPAATTIEECWDLVDTHQVTGTNLMFLENANYDRSFLAILNMVRQDVFGELLHCRCGYLHDLRGVKFNDGVEYDYVPGRPLKFGQDAYAEAQWRGLHSIRRNGDVYPTHGIGPVAKVLDIHNGNRFLSISSFATKAVGLKKYVEDYGGKDHPLSKIRWNCGDIVTSTINCANGETVLVTHNCNNPRPHVGDYMVQGTKGLWYDDWKSIYIENISPVKDTYEADESWITKYNHKYWREEAANAAGSGHGGIDYMVLNDFFKAVKDNKPAPIDVYDAAAWSAISALSEMSISRGSIPVDFPDFTRGQWIRFKDEKVFATDEKFPMLSDRYIKY